MNNGIVIDTKNRKVIASGKTVELRGTAFGIFCCLAERAGEYLSCDHFNTSLYQDVDPVESSILRGSLERIDRKFQAEGLVCPIQKVWGGWYTIPVGKVTFE